VQLKSEEEAKIAREKAEEERRKSEEEAKIAREKTEEERRKSEEEAKIAREKTEEERRLQQVQVDALFKTYFRFCFLQSCIFAEYIRDSS
jgi:sRNA-binding protein